MDDQSGKPVRARGGGPPGGSAFDRHGRVRPTGARRVLATDDAFTTAESIPDSPKAPHPPGSEPGQPPRRNFPGGRVTLPRLDGKDGASVHLTGAAFRPDNRAESSAAPSGSIFTEYFTHDSLFSDSSPSDSSPSDSSSPAGDSANSPPAVIAAYAELRLPPGSSPHDVATRHRALVKEFHPDRFGDEEPEARERAEEEIRRINNAYDTIRRHRPDPV